MQEALGSFPESQKEKKREAGVKVGMGSPWKAPGVSEEPLEGRHPRDPQDAREDHGQQRVQAGT